MADNVSSERRAWSQEEDDALRVLYEETQANRWNLIAEKLQSEYGFAGRSGKQCRERYASFHKDTTTTSTPPSPRMNGPPQKNSPSFDYTTHSATNGRSSASDSAWAGTSRSLRTDNTVKNHFYSRLRKSLRRLNKVICERYKKTMREIRPQVLYKIIEASE